ncbi:MAG TPA: AraC family transcriptional regulator [Sporosarcina psychrophila]|uniref:AraC family transcriptional regulator n=1 Tax=Sporosarcina psychrophila TaxID=1476 RepID=A0A921FX07_SPOPS|nr:AraC family transcriptional regulator [Sporosarcina psychrophila]
MSNEVYELKDNPVAPLPVKLLYVTEAKYDRDWHSSFHSHFFTELIYVTKGKGFFNLLQEKIPIQENQLVIVNENIDHTEESDPKSWLEYIALGIQGVFLTDKNNKENAPVSIFTINREREDVQYILKMLLAEVKQQKKPDLLILHNLLEVLLVHLFRNNNVELEKNEANIFHKDVSTAKHYIDLNFRENITLDQLAKITHINKYYLAHSFKKSLSLSPIEYLNKVRIQNSKYLLESTNHPISFISSISGFSSASYFSQAFKRLENISPLQYRKKSKAIMENKK